MTTSSPTKVDYTQEVRFAIVMYGGISLAIYINGVAQELLHLVRSTAPDVLPDDGAGISIAKYTDDELEGSERVYRKLGQMLVRGIPTLDPPKVPRKENTEETAQETTEKTKPDIRTRFMVDILSGSSAGGINAVFLAKALTNDQPLKDLEKLWIQEGDMAVLINDRESLKNTELRLQDPPKSLLNSQRMYWQLLDALEEMEKAKPSSAGGSTNVEELDLFVTATDLQGQIIKIQLADQMVEERRHRKVFHFVYDAETDPVTGKPRNDFHGENNPFLAFAARSTSAHPAAFEPMQLGGIDDILQRHDNYRNRYDVRSNYPRWQKFYEEYLQPRDSDSGLDSTAAEKDHEKRVSQFANRAFNDGGVLDNQPFGHTIDALPRHHSSFPTVRKLLYIEPAPDNPKADPDEPTPDFVDNAWLSLSTLPRYEPIREHLERVLERNRLVERVEHVTRGMEEDIRHMRERPHVPDADEFKKADLEKMIKMRGFGWASYQRLRVAEVTDELVLLIARTLGFDEKSDEFRAVWYIVRHWRRQHYVSYLRQEKPLTNEPSTVEATETRFLMDFDLPWRLRRLRFVMSKIDALAGFDKQGEQTFRAALEGDESNIPYPTSGSDKDRADRQRLRGVLLKVKRSFSSSCKTLRLNRRRLWSSPVAAKEKLVGTPAGLEGQPEGATVETQITGVRAAINKFDVTRDDLSSLLRRLTEKELEDRLDTIVDSKKTEFQDFQTKLGALLLAWTSESRTTCETALARKNNSSPPDETAIRHAIAFYFDYFDFYDMIAHPILYATDAGEELDYIEVYRVSPQDANGLIDEKKEKKRKLAGTKLANFGAFFKQEFRTNDILWGRLDGAERIITALLPDEVDKEKRCALINEAHEEILKEVLGVEDESHLLSVLQKLSECAENKPDQGDVKKNGESRRRFSPSAERNLSSSVTDARIKFALETFLNSQTPVEHFREQFTENYKTARQFNSQDMVTDAARASKVFGKMLEGYTKLHQVDSKRVVWVTRMAQLFWGLVQVAIPGSIANLVFNHWLKLLYLFEFLLILLGTLLANRPAQQFGWLTFGITVAVHAAQLILSDTLRGKHWFRNFLVAVLALAVLLMTVLGVFSLLGIFFYDSLWRILSSVQTWRAQPVPLGWNTMTLAKAGLVALVGAFLGRALWKDVSEPTRTRLLGLLPLLLGLAVSASMIFAYYRASQQGQLLPGGLHMPALAIELARQPADVLEIQRRLPIDALRTGVTVDFGFIVLYTMVFLSFSFWLAQQGLKHSMKLGIVAGLSAIATAGFDVLENFRLYTILDAAQNPEMWMIRELYTATVLKWSFCFVTVGLLSLLFLLRKDRLAPAGAGLLLVSGVGLVGLFVFHPALELAFGALGVLLAVIGLFITVLPEKFLTVWR